MFLVLLKRYKMVLLIQIRQTLVTIVKIVCIAYVMVTYFKLIEKKTVLNPDLWYEKLHYRKQFIIPDSFGHFQSFFPVTLFIILNIGVGSNQNQSVPSENSVPFPCKSPRNTIAATISF